MSEQLRLKIEQAATSMLSDAEICVSLNINETTLRKHYDTVEKSRVVLKQKLNARRISDAASNGGPQVSELVENIPRSRPKVSSRGGARPGAGRKPGTTNKLSAQTLLSRIEIHTGEAFEDLLAQGYSESIINRDKQTRLQYEKMFLSKVVADRIDMEVTENSDAVAAKSAAFAAALATLQKRSQDSDKS